MLRPKPKLFTKTKTPSQICLRRLHKKLLTVISLMTLAAVLSASVPARNNQPSPLAINNFAFHQPILAAGFWDFFSFLGFGSEDDKKTSVAPATTYVVDDKNLSADEVNISQAIASPPPAIVVSSSNPQGWGTADTRTGGAVTFVADADAAGAGALQMTTDGTTAAKAQYFHLAPANTALQSVTDLSYYTKQNSGSPVFADAAYQFTLCLDGVNQTTGGCNALPANGAGSTSGFTTLVYEPYQQSATITPDVFEFQDVDAGQIYSTQTRICPNGTINGGGGGGGGLFTLDTVKAACPNAVVAAYGLNIGTNNANYNVETDLFNFNGTVYNFESAPVCATGPSYDVTAQFSVGSNPNCQFSYGNTADSGPDSAFTAYPFASSDEPIPGVDRWHRDSPDGDLVPAVFKNRNSTTATYLGINHPPEDLNLHPGDQGERSVVRFTAPSDGNYQINGLFESIAGGGATTDVLVLKRSVADLTTSTVLLTGDINQTTPTQAIAIPFVPLVTGDVIEFSVGYGNGTYGSDSTGLRAVIEPSETVRPMVTVSPASGTYTTLSPITFTFQFNEPVTGFDIDDIAVTNGAKSNFTGSGQTYTVDVTPNGTGTVTVSVPQDAAVDASMNGNAASNTASITDGVAPTATIAQAMGQADPTNVSPVNFTVIFNEPVTDFDDATDVEITGTAFSATNPATVTIMGSGTTYNVAVSGMGMGTIIANVPAGVAVDAANNLNAAAVPGDNTVTFDNAGPTATINQRTIPNQPDPTSASPINFTVTFNEPVTDFDDDTDVTVTGTAFSTTDPAGTPVVEIERIARDFTVYNVSVSGMTSSGTVIANVPAGVAVDGQNNSNTAATFTDNTVNFALETLYALTNPAGTPTTQNLITFSSSNPNTAATTLPILGLPTGVTLVGIDFRPSTLVTTPPSPNLRGILYGLGSDGAGNGSLYTINTTSGAATRVGTTAVPLGNASQFGFDFNPTVDRIRVVSNSTTTISSFRLNPDNGAIANAAPMDAALNGDATSATAAAYTNNDNDPATGTTLFDISGGTLYRQGDPNATPPVSPNSGTLFEIGPLGVTATDINGFDISGTTTTAYAALQAASGSESSLYTINLTTGAASLVGTIGGTTGNGLVIRGLTATPSEGASVDNTSPTVTVEQAANQPDPTNAQPINFTVIFSEAVTGFTSSDVVLGGTSGGTAGATATVTGSGTTYNIAVSGLTVNGTVTATVPAASAVDLQGNPNAASTSADNSVTFTRPAISISDVTMTEGDNGTKTFDFTVSISNAITEEVTVNYATANGTATASNPAAAGDDYVATSGTVTFSPGPNSRVSKVVSITVNGDMTFEPDETFFVNLSGNSANSTIGDPQGIGTITNDDACNYSVTPTGMSFGPAGGTGTFAVTVNQGCAIIATSNNPEFITVTGVSNNTVSYSVASNAPSSGNSGAPRSGTITIGGTGSNTATFTVTQPDAQALVVTAPTITGQLLGADVSVPISVTDTTGRGIFSYDFTINYDPAVLQFNPTISQTGTVSAAAGFSVAISNSTPPGTLKISGFEGNPSLPLSGSGTLFNLRFTVIGTANPQTSNLTFGSPSRFNEGTPAVTTVNGSISTINGTVMGTVTYGVTPIATVTPTPKPVTGVTVSADDTNPNSPASSDFSTTTACDGTYSLSMFSSDPYTITPTKANNFNNGAVSSADAAAVQSFVLQRPNSDLSPSQRIVADVSGNGEITSFDAALIQRYVTNSGMPPASTQINKTGLWVFDPTSRMYTAMQLQANQSSENYSAILFGDVTGSYNAITDGCGTQPAISGEKSDQSNVAIANGAPVMVNLPTQGAGSNATFDIPISVDDVTNLNVNSYDLVFSYDPAVLQPQTTATDRNGTLSNNFSVSSAAAGTGRLRVSGFSSDGEPLSGNGTLLKLRFRAVGAAGSTSNLSFTSFRFNEGTPTNTTGNGQFTVLSPTAATATISGRVTTASRRGIAGATVTLTDSNGVSRSTAVNLKGFYQFDGVRTGETYVVSVSGKGFTGTEQVITVLDNLTGVDLSF